MNNVTDLVLDGNATANLLQQLFVPDVTLATIRCEACEDCVIRGPILLNSNLHDAAILHQIESSTSHLSLHRTLRDQRRP